MNYLDEIAKDITTLKGINRQLIVFQHKVIKKYFVGKRALELGCMDGMMTSLLMKDFDNLLVVDGSELAIERLKENINSSNIDTMVGLFEDVTIESKFDTIIMGHILEHVDDPVSILEKFKNNLSYGGRIIISVPNAKSFHRMAGVRMGLLESIYDLNENDRLIGHKRVYDFDSLKSDIDAAGLSIIFRDAYWIKFLSHKQIEETWDQKLIEAYMELGHEFCENAAEIVMVCENK